MKLILILVILGVQTVSVNAQFLELTTEVGYLISNVSLTSTEASLVDSSIGRHFNTSKNGYYVSSNINYSILKWLTIEGGLTYQERKPLEIFKFGIGGNNVPAGIGATFIFSDYPTSPQSRNWNRDIHIRFPNFRYLHTEIIPMLTLQKKEINIYAGIGVFYGKLLNQNQLIFDRSFFPNADFYFEPPHHVSGEIRYFKDDFGWIPKLKLNFPIKNNIRLNMSAKMYISQSGLIKEEYYNRWFKSSNTNWLVYTVGVGITYDFKRNINY